MHITSCITATVSACTGPTTHWRRGSSITIDVIELPDPPSREQAKGLIRNNVQMADIYLPNFFAPQDST